jgi:hypothetical protein
MNWSPRQSLPLFARCQFNAGNLDVELRVNTQQCKIIGYFPPHPNDLRASLKIPTPFIDLIESRYHGVEIMGAKYEPAWIF